MPVKIVGRDGDDFLLEVTTWCGLRQKYITENYRAPRDQRNIEAHPRHISAFAMNDREHHVRKATISPSVKGYREIQNRFRFRARSEASRVRELLARDKAYQAREAYRTQAEMEIAEGRFVNLSDTVVEPTEEWLEKGETRTFVPKQPDGTTRVIRTVRRVVIPIVTRLHSRSLITDDQYASCLWYRAIYDRAWMVGRLSSNIFNNAATLSGGRDKRLGGAAGHSPITEEELYNRELLRAARTALPERKIPFFDAIVIEDQSLRKASRIIRCRNGDAPAIFSEVAECLARHCSERRVDLKGFGRD